MTGREQRPWWRSIARFPAEHPFRVLLALGFVAILFLVPEANRGRLAQLGTRSWLLGDDSPLAEARADGDETPQTPVRILPTVQESPPLTGDALARRVEEYVRIGREWNRQQHLPPEGGDRPRLLPLAVRVGDTGYLSVLDTGGDSPPKHEVAHPDRWSLLPPILAIVIAILTSRIVPALLLGCVLGAIQHRGAVFDGTVHFVRDTFWARTLNDDFNLEIIGFVVFLFMGVGIMARSGGLQGMVEAIRKLARGPKSTQLTSFLIGLAIFFDDYSNCIITGTTMRPLTDMNRVSRERLAYIVDSTAAPIAGISIFSTWVAYEVSMFAPQLPEVTHPDGRPFTETEGFAVFVQTLPFRFYCIFTLLMVAATILLRREWGPMLTAERRAVHEGKPVADDAQPMVARGFAALQAPAGARLLARNAVLPVLLLVTMTIGLIAYYGITASDELAGTLREQIVTILNNAESQKALFWASLSALGLASVLAMLHRILSPGQILDAAVRSVKSLVFAIVILLLAWSIGHTCRDLGTAPFLTSAFLDAFDGRWLPLVMFLLASLVSFSTGTSYGTMAIILPNVVVLSHTMGEQVPGLGGTMLMFLTIGAVLEGSIFGDHCSPISDTTVLSSVGTGSDHLHHVRTQAPYALMSMGMAMVFGYLPVAMLDPGEIGRTTLALICIAGGLGAMVLFLLLVGRNPDRETAPAQPAA